MRGLRSSGRALRTPRSNSVLGTQLTFAVIIVRVLVTVFWPPHNPKSSILNNPLRNVFVAHFRHFRGTCDRLGEASVYFLRTPGGDKHGNLWLTPRLLIMIFVQFVPFFQYRKDEPHNKASLLYCREKRGGRCTENVSKITSEECLFFLPVARADWCETFFLRWSRGFQFFFFNVDVMKRCNQVSLMFRSENWRGGMWIKCESLLGNRRFKAARGVLGWAPTGVGVGESVGATRASPNLASELAQRTLVLRSALPTSSPNSTLSSPEFFASTACAAKVTTAAAACLCFLL